MNHELEANIYNKKCLFLNTLIVTIVFILNKLKVFIINDSLINKAYFPSISLLIISLFILHFVDITKPWVKYFIITVEVIVVHIMSLFLTYHLTVFLAIPFLMVAHYHNKRIVWYAYILNSLGIILSVLLGYEYGICDMNMVIFTNNTIDSYMNLDNFVVSHLSTNNASQILLFFALPRILLTFIFLRMSLSLADSSMKTEKKQQEAEFNSYHDNMTNLYNKNKYSVVIKELRKQSMTVGILYFDINNLKNVNDTYNHDYGDRLICMAAKSLTYIQSQNTDIFRIGGDEFVVIIKECTETDLKTTTKVWENALRLVNEENIELTCSMALGTAWGDSNKIESLIKEADSNMYINKKEIKSHKN